MKSTASILTRVDIIHPCQITYFLLIYEIINPKNATQVIAIEPTNGETTLPKDDSKEGGVIDVVVAVVLRPGAGEEVVVPGDDEDGVVDDPDATVTASFIPLPQCPTALHMK